MKKMITASKTASAITVIGCCLLAIVLSACTGGDGEQMRAQLEELERQNREYENFTTDSLAKQLVDYFDRHGTANERLRAHYILGCVYRDLGEAPHAIDCYQDAIDRADTTAADFDARTLGCIYSQMGDVFHRQLLLANEIEARRKSCHYFHLAGDTLSFLAGMKLSASAYYLLNKRDSAEILLKEALRLYEEYGYVQDGVRSSTMLMFFYMDSQEHNLELKQLIDIYDASCSWFDDHHELPPSKRQFYYYKGKYFEGVGRLDSAEYYYRKIYFPNMGVLDETPLYEGLLSIFTKRHQADSIAKYAQLYCKANDSTVVVNDQQLTAQMAASYNYNRYQKEALQNAEKSYRATLSLIIISILSVIILLAASYLMYRYKKNHMRLQEAYESAVNRREDLLKELETLKAHDYDTLIAQKEEKIKEQNQAIAELEGKSGEGALQDFKESQIVKTFAEKSLFTKEHPVPNKAEWDMLEQQFRNDLPGLCRLFEDKGLSDLELRTCLLLMLDYDEGTIAGLTQSSSPAVTTAKARANQKLFHQKGAKTLKIRLKRLI